MVDIIDIEVQEVPVPPAIVRHRRKEDHNGGHAHKRARVLTDEDLEQLEKILMARHPCRFNSVDTQDFSAAMEFYKKFNEALDDSKSLVRRTILVMIIAAICGWIGVGFWNSMPKQ